MDDSVIGLTFLYDIDSKRQPSSNVPGRPVRQMSRKSVELINEQDNIIETSLPQKAKNNSKKNKVNGGHKKASRSKVQREVDFTSKNHSKTQVHKSNDSYDTGGECFTCLPGIEDQEDSNKIHTEMSELSDSSSESGSPVRFSTNDRVLPLNNDSLSTQQQEVVDSSLLVNSPAPPPPQNYWLMRLFQSNLFDMSIAIGYLFNSKEADVQAYLGNKLFVSDIWVTVWGDCGVGVFGDGSLSL